MTQWTSRTLAVATLALSAGLMVGYFVSKRLQLDREPIMESSVVPVRNAARTVSQQHGIEAAANLPVRPDLASPAVPADNPAASEQAAMLQHLLSSEEQWQAEPIDMDFVQAHQQTLMQKLESMQVVQSADVKCRNRTCKVDVVFGAGAHLDALESTLADPEFAGFSPYRRTEHGWTFFFNPDLVE